MYFNTLSSWLQYIIKINVGITDDWRPGNFVGQRISFVIQNGNPVSIVILPKRAGLNNLFYSS